MSDGFSLARPSDVDAVRRTARPFEGPQDYDSIVKAIGDARIVLIGEASHGTHDFYRARAELTKRLIDEKGFGAVAIEGDWPDAWRVNRYVQNESDDTGPSAALAGFRRFPTWMWRNTDARDFVSWLREWNDAHPGATAGFYGLDLYSLHASMDAVLSYLDRTDPAAATRARARYSCFDHFGEDAQVYGQATALGMEESCEQEVVAQLVELQRRGPKYTGSHRSLAADDHFQAEQNARLVRNAEEYYRSMFRGRTSSWNLRDGHMHETLVDLIDHLVNQSRSSKVVVWAHNSHLGDARATQMGWAGELNLGQLVREARTEESFLIGFSTHEGTVTAARDWGDPPQRTRVRPSLVGSSENLFHETELGRFWILSSEAPDALDAKRLERAIGVIYRPETERVSHYFEARLKRQFDAVIHLDVTRAVEPLEPGAHWSAGHEVPETYPTGI